MEFFITQTPQDYFNSSQTHIPFQFLLIRRSFLHMKINYYATTSVTAPLSLTFPCDTDRTNFQ